MGGGGFSVCSSLVKIVQTRLMVVRSLPKKINNKQTKKVGTREALRQSHWKQNKTKNYMLFVYIYKIH